MNSHFDDDDVDDDSACSDDDFGLIAEREDDDFPPEEEDEDNPDWYRNFDPSDQELLDSDVTEDDLDWDDEVPDEDLNPYLEPTAAPPANLTLHFDASGYYAYVLAKKSLIPFSEGEAAHLQKALVAKGIQIAKGGRSFQPASDGVQYDWYLRVRTIAGAKPNAEAVQLALRDFASGATLAVDEPSALLPKRSSLAGIPQLEAETLALGVSQKLVASRAAERALTARFDQFRVAAAEREALLVERIEGILADQQAKRVEEDLESFIEHLKSVVVELRELIQAQDKELQAGKREIAEYHAAFDDDLLRANAEATRAREERDKAIAQLENTESARSHYASKTGLKSLVGALLPKVRFHGGSFDILHKELPDPLPALSLIGEVVAHGMARKAKAVRSASPWIRARFRTGTNNDGRLYYARNRLSECWEMVVSRKGQQQEDVSFIRTISLS